MFTSTDLTDPTLPDLHIWSLLTGCSAAALILASVIILLWNLLRHERNMWQYIVVLFLFALGCWSLVGALLGYQQWASFGQHLPHSITEDYLRFIIGPAYWADVQRCQLQFGIGLVALAIVGLWWLLSHFVKRAATNRQEISPGSV